MGKLEHGRTLAKHNDSPQYEKLGQIEHFRMTLSTRWSTTQLIDTEGWRPLAEKLIGVIDLKAGQAVHGIAGNRKFYRPVRLDRDGGLLADGQSADGRPAALVDWYRGFGIRKFYVADLDALMGGAMQIDAIEKLLGQSNGRGEGWMLDVGIGERTIGELSQWIRGPGARWPRVDWILSSESATSPDLIDAVSEHIEASSLILGIDFRNGQFVGPGSGLDVWLERAAALGLTRALVLDVALVGTKRGPLAAEWCRGLCQRYPHWEWISGGGCRSVPDVNAFLDAGCTACLIASALLPSPHATRRLSGPA